MVSPTHTRAVERRLPAAKRKYQKAIQRFINESVFTSQTTYFEFKPRKDAVEITTYFMVNGDTQRYRFDYEINLSPECKLPLVGEIRDFMYRSFKDYKKGMGPGAWEQNSTWAVPAPLP